MDLDQLKQFEAIARLGTVSAAANELLVSQPAVSRSLARLEKELGCQLFERKGRRVELSAAGTAALEFARSMLREERLMRAALGELQSRSGTILVGTVAPAPLWRLTALSVERFPSRLLSSRIQSQQDLERSIINGDIDLGIGAKPLAYPGVRCCHLLDESLGVSVPLTHPLASKESLKAEDLEGERFLLYEQIGFWESTVKKALPHCEFVMQNDYGVFEQLAVKSDVLSFVSDAVGHRLELPNRAVIPFNDPSGQASFYLLIRSDANAAARELFEWVEKEKAREEPAPHRAYPSQATATSLPQKATP